MSAGRIDHANEAKYRIETSDGLSVEDGALVEAAVAQAYATLALAEQQRIANRIALAQATAQAVYASGFHRSTYGLIGLAGIFDNPETEHGPSVLHADVREALGLS